MMYIVFIIDHIHHLMNESKIMNFAYNNDKMVCIFLKKLMRLYFQIEKS